LLVRRGAITYCDRVHFASDQTEGEKSLERQNLLRWCSMYKRKERENSEASLNNLARKEAPKTDFSEILLKRGEREFTRDERGRRGMI